MLRINDKNSGAKDSFDCELFNLGSNSFAICPSGMFYSFTGSCLLYFKIFWHRCPKYNGCDLFSFSANKNQISIYEWPKFDWFASDINL